MNKKRIDELLDATAETTTPRMTEAVRSVQAKLDSARFDRWMRCVDFSCDVIYGVSVEDMPDARWRNYFDDEMQPREALVEAAKDW